MTRPRLLDLFCGAGGAAMGYHRAGFDVLGVDNRSQPRYPFPFVQGDALKYLAEHGREFDAIHASPPCQEYTALKGIHGKSYPDLVAPTRALLQQSDRPRVIENVPGAPLTCPIILCGTMFGLRTYRHRLFESPWLIFQPMPHHPRHTARTAGIFNCTKAKTRAVLDGGGFMVVAGHFADVEAGAAAMGIDWMVGKELSQAIPPAYTQFIGERLLTAMM